MQQINIAGAKIVLEPNKCDYAIYLASERTVDETTGTGGLQIMKCVEYLIARWVLAEQSGIVVNGGIK